MKQKQKLTHRQKRKLQQRIIFGIVAAVLGLGLIMSSVAWSTGDRFLDNNKQPAAANNTDTAKAPTVEELESQLKEKPDDAKLIAQLASAYIKANNAAKAVELYENSVAKYPENSDLRLKAAVTFYLAGQNEKAVTYLKDEIAKSPDNKEAYYLYAQVLAGQQQYKEAATQIDKFIQLAGTGNDVVKAKQMLEEWNKLAAGQ